MVQVVDGEPTLEILMPRDGKWFTNPEVMVRGTAFHGSLVWEIDGDEFTNGTFKDLKLSNGNVVFNPLDRFSDHFDGLRLDHQRWEVVSGGSYALFDSKLILQYDWTNRSFPMIISRGDPFPEDADWTAYISLAFNGTYDNEAEMGLGITANLTNPDNSTMAIHSNNTLEDTLNHRYWMFLDGIVKRSWNYDDYPHEMGHLKVVYTHANRTYKLHHQKRVIGSVSDVENPSKFWIGNPLYGQLWNASPDYIVVHSVGVWTFTGTWTSQVLDFGGGMFLNECTPVYSSSHMASSHMSIELRTSEDNVTWSDWGKTYAGQWIDGPYVQFRAMLGLDEIRSDLPDVTLSGIRLEYMHRLANVQVRVNGGEWQRTRGTLSWDLTVTLAEDDNVLEVRAIDTGGHTNTSSINLLLDTTIPVGTFQMVPSGGYTTDTNVTLYFNATDRYGVPFIHIADYPDFRWEVVEPYVDSLPWVLPGGRGENYVYVRYEDSHGLISETHVQAVIYDPYPPTAALYIEDGAAHTENRSVRLDLEYNDPEGIDLIQVSNDPQFTDAQVVPDGLWVILDWDLGEGGTGVRQVFMRVTDKAGNNVTVSAEILLYVAKPEGGITIEEGAKATGDLAVQVQIELPSEFSAIWMQMANSTDFNGSAWVQARTVATFLFPPEDGLMKVYIRFMDSRRYMTLPVTDSIILDRTPPELTVTLGGGEHYTMSTTTEAVLTYGDLLPPSHLWVSDSDDRMTAEEVPYQDRFSWSFQHKEGSHGIHVWVADGLNNTAYAFDVIYFATVPPVCEMTIVGGEYTNAYTDLEIEVNAIDVYGTAVEVQLGFDGFPGPGATWQSSKGVLTLDIPYGAEEGSHQVTLRARNSIGLVSEVISTTVVLDRTQPTVEIINPKGGSSLWFEDAEVKLVVMTHDENGIAEVRYSVDQGEWHTMSPEAPSIDIDLGSWGSHTINVIVVDMAGNEAMDQVKFKVQKDTAVRDILVVMLVSAGAIGIGFLIKRGRGRKGDEWEEVSIEDEG
jgi:hypothetical protein